MKNIYTTIGKFILETTDNTEFLYHGTSLENAENIIDGGFTEDTYWGDESIAEEYAYSYDKPVLIKMNKSEIYDLLEPNTTLLNFYEENIEEDDDYEHIVEEWNNSEGTVEDSLNIFGSVILPISGVSISEENIINI